MSSFGEVTELLDYPMFVVTTAADGERDGCLIGFATQVSIDPARFLVLLSDKNRTTRLAARADRLVVHVLTAEQREMAELFGGETGDEVDKLARCSWHDGPGGAPVLDGVAAWFSGPIVERVPFGDHIGHLIEPDEAWTAPSTSQLLSFQQVKDMEPGHDA
jgi:flavin reductase (DIM6/NTAB) family NADH-FMN oxidoreductase RutF